MTTATLPAGASTPTRQGEYILVPGRAVFDVHQEFDPAGKLVRAFGVKELTEIAQRCNVRDAKGALCPLTIGHTSPGRPETEQPVAVGYARNFRVGPDPVTGAPALLADFYFHQQHYELASTYARVSVELWPNDWVIDPIALLRRTPKLDLPQWVYGKLNSEGQPVLRYSRNSDMPLPGGGGVPPSPTNAMPGGAPPGGGPGMPEKVDAYMKHCHSHPYAREIAAHYGAGEAEMGGGEPPMPPLGAEPPGAAPPAPPPGGGAMPMPPPPPQQFSRDPEVARLERELSAMRRENTFNSRRQDLQALANDGVMLDVEQELYVLGDLPVQQYQRELARIRDHYARDPVQFGGMIPVLGRGEEPGQYGRGPQLVKDGALTMAGTRAIQKYQREHPEMTYEQAREAFIRENGGGAGSGTASTNGHHRTGRG